MVTDEYIIEYFYGKSSFIKRNNIKPYNDEIKDYLENRFSDSKSIYETIFRIKHHIEVRPKCAYCGNDVLFVGKNSKAYQKYCCRTCLSKSNVEKIKDKYGTTCTLTLNHVKEKTLNTLQEHYGEGVTHNWKAKEVHKKCVETTNKRYTRDEITARVRQTKLKRYGDEKYVNVQQMKKTKLEKYGDENYTNKEKTKKTCLKKYGVEYAIGAKEVRNKIKQSYINHYGVDSPLKSEEVKNKIKQTCLKKYGVDSPFKSEIIREKLYNTLKKNNTFNTSDIEKTFKQYLTDHNIQFEYQYKTESYPYKCDFYLNKYDLYIEIQGTWTHGGHPFNPNSIEDINKLNEWKSKNTDYYDSAIHTWTVSDVKKRNTAKQNNLKYLEIFSKNIKEIVSEINLFLNINISDTLYNE